MTHFLAMLLFACLSAPAVALVTPLLQSRTVNTVRAGTPSAFISPLESLRGGGVSIVPVTYCQREWRLSAIL
jgi:hypothetical protein